MDYEEKVIALLNSQELSKEQKEKLENIFPELKESEDEKIRKTLIEHIKGITSWNYFLGISKEQMIAWLKKQGEKKELKKIEPKKVNANKVIERINIEWINADKVIEWLKNTIKASAENYGVFKATHLTLPYNSIEDLINDFKEDFGL